MLKKYYSMISLSVLILIVGFTSPIFAQEKIVKPTNQITLKITAPNGTWATVSVFEGEELTFTDEKTGRRFVFVPTVFDAKERIVEVKAHQFANVKTNESSVETLNVKIGSSINTQSSFKIEVKAIAKHLPDETEGIASFKTISYDSSSVASTVAQQCCINCGGYRICSNCSVSTECGCCCTSRPTCCQSCQ
jgi:hypothetical protein